MKRPLRTALAAGLTLAALAAPSAASAASVSTTSVSTTSASTTSVSTTSASAQRGVYVKTYRYSYLRFPSAGTARAQLRNVTVTWRKDTADKRVWVTVSGQLRDSGPGDGHCARLKVWRHGGVGEVSTKECNGVWQSRTLSIDIDDEAFMVLQTNPKGDGTAMRLANPWRAG
ncbi:hypothetical protein IMZ11_15125 [Microtetraspora sp. AC03309]|uniref:hypothetical protein n=1 Tax=Microtetraspora sp. AC03309 TaxID=2779376 RepID=UPI001E3A60F5|nr:hypothetical protein [Microtetraspora sp. AC03309]MCC5576960.1 hypothetical protein [Microtetraspora sp. AC03309]